MEDIDQNTQIWDIISEDDCFVTHLGLYVFNISGCEYKLTENFKFSEFCNISDDFKLKFTVLWDYITNPQNISNITIIEARKSEIGIKFGNLRDSYITNTGDIKIILAPMISKNKDKITAAYMLLKYLTGAPYNHCLVCGCVIHWNREVCSREVCIVINWNRPSGFTDITTTYQKVIRLAVKGATQVHLSPKIIEFNEVDDRISMLYYHLMIYNFEDCRSPPAEVTESGYIYLQNTEPNPHTEITVIGYHGSPIGKWASILRSGLINLSGTEHMSTGAAYGKGVYFSKTIDVAKGYAGNGIIAICEFPEPDIRDTYYVVPDHTKIYIKYIIFPERILCT